MMKRKRLDRNIWTSIISKRYFQQYVKEDDFEGIVSLLYIDEVSKPSIWEDPNNKITVCANGMKWLQILPTNDNYLITAMINNQNEIEVWYIDIIVGYGYDTDNVIFFDDLYLDLIISPNGDLKIDDMDELEEALKQNDITMDLYSLAISTKDKLQKEILDDLSKFYHFCMKLLQKIENNNTN